MSVSKHEPKTSIQCIVVKYTYILNRILIYLIDHVQNISFLQQRKDL